MSVQGVNPQQLTAPMNPVAIISTRTNAHLAAFFAQFPGFHYDPSQSVATEFKRLKESPQWPRRKIKQDRWTGSYRLALVLQFNETYGTDGDDLESWQNLCRVVRMKNIPNTVSGCKKAIEKVHVNLVDLVDKPNMNIKVKRFNKWTLRQYTMETEKFFPREDAKAGGILKHLLREIIYDAEPQRQARAA
ncbi:hypothetical protein FRC07_014211 [Ceratobasidium sp. 392]|nr:hypothetical protein FRC07_014211 [Ceratobasidium sp. 392]